VAAIDRAMDRLRQQRANLWERRNALMPISTLPSEISAQIFHLACDWWPPFMLVGCFRGDWFPHISDPSAVITLSHVSRSFRSVVLATRTLWTAIDTSEPDPEKLVHMLLERSLPMPFTVVTMGVVSVSAHRLLHILREEKATIRHLWLSHGHQFLSVSQALGDIADSDVLESLHLNLPDNSDASPIETFGLRNLTVLSLEGPGRLMPSGSAALFRLTRLALELNDLEPHEMLRAASLICNAPLLTELRVNFSERGRLWDHYENTAPVTVSDHLPTSSCRFLKKMTLTGDDMCTLTLLYLILPGPACHIRVIEGRESPSFSVLHRFLARHPFGQDVVNAIISRSHKSDGYVRWRLHSGSADSTGNTTLLDFEANQEETGSLALAIQWNRLASLRLKLGDHELASLIFDAVRGSRALVSLGLFGTQTALRLFPRLRARVEEGEHEIPFPALTRIGFEGIRMRHLETEPGQLHDTHMLLRIARERAALGVPWKTMVLHRCVFDGAVTMSTLCAELAQLVESVLIE
jgi:hypothetical protein